MGFQDYRVIEHTADTGFEVKGGSRQEVFENAARAFFDIMWQIETVQENVPETIEVSGMDAEELLVNFLEEFLYLYEAKNLVCTYIKVKDVADDRVRAEVRLQEFDEQRDEELLSVKAVTYHQLYLGRQNKTWTARIFVDI